MASSNKKYTALLGHPYLRATALVLLGLFLGWLFFSGSEEAGHTHSHEASHEATVYTCSMHPHIKQDSPGKCPICAMDLTPLKSSSGGHSEEHVHPDALQMSKEAVALANIQTIRIEPAGASKSISLYGRVQADERLVQRETSHVSGRIESLAVSYLGQAVGRGQTLATVYSPDLYNAQQELLLAVEMGDADLRRAAEQKLSFWKLNPQQIEQIIRAGKPNPIVAIKASTTGVVTEQGVRVGDYVEAGSTLMSVAGQARMWVVFDAYEADLPFLKQGQSLKFTLQAFPGETFESKITFVDPVLDPQSRTARIRVEVDNARGRLKAEMNALATVDASLATSGNELVIPSSAVLWTGKRSIVWVKDAQAEMPTFMLREVVLGESLGSSYIVREGLSAGEEIVVQGAFTIDATAQLEGKRSMMGVEPGERQSKTLHVQGACEMCKERIETTAKAQTGVISASWDSKTQLLKLELAEGKGDVKAISAAIAGVGHDTEHDKAPESVYSKLPPCCQYRGE